jgi:hypothetical protein
MYKTVVLPVKATLTRREERKLIVFGNRMLRRIFGPKREEVARGWSRLHNEELHNLYASPNIVRVVKSRSVRWVGHVVCMEEMKNIYRILVGKPEGKDRSEDLDVDGRIILEWFLQK